MFDSLFTQISALLALTVGVAYILHLMRQPLLVAYIIAGIVAGPLFLNFIHGDQEAFAVLAEFGVVLLLFVVGLSLNFDHIKKIGKVSLITGITQVVFTAGVGYLILQALDFERTTSIFLALALTFSSTIIIVKLLGDKKDMESVYGRHVIGLMIVQDLIAILIMMVLTNQSETGGFSWLLVADIGLKILALAALVVLISRFLIPKILPHIAKSTEFLFIFTIAWCFGIASLLFALGFSVEIGAIIAGLTLGSSPFQAEISSRIRPLRDFFIILFFIILGSEMVITNPQAVIIPAAILSFFILFGNPFILYHTFRLLKFTRRNSFFAGVTAAQVSEFGFILLFTGGKLGFLTGDELPVFTLVALITIFVSSYAITYNEAIYRFLTPVFQVFGKDKHLQIEETIKQHQVWVFGYHRLGWKICETLKGMGVHFAVVDFNPNAIAKLRRRGIPAIYGDATDIDFLEHLPLTKAKLVISTLPTTQDQITLIQHIRKSSTRTHIVANLYHSEHLDTLYGAGANYVMLPHHVSGKWISEILKDKSWTKRTFKELKKEQRQELKLFHTSPDDIA